MSQIIEIEPTADERRNAWFSPESLNKAGTALREDGVVVLRNVVSQQSISALLERSLQDLERLRSRPDAPYNWTKGNIQQDPPPFPPYLFRDVLVNDFAIQVTSQIFGPGMKNGFYSGNTAMPSESRQPVHADQGQLWPNLQTATPPYALVVNIPLVSMGPENGSTEIWPGTHLDTSVTMQDGDIEVRPERLEEQRRVRPPLQPVVDVGSIVIRDIRMWHAGMPNRTSAPRPMIAMIHVVSWWPTSPIRFGEGSEPYLKHPHLEWAAEFTNEPIDHISGVSGHKSEEAGV